MKRVGAGLLLLAALGCAKSTSTASSSGAPCTKAPAGAFAEIDQRDFRFEPPCVEMTTDQAFSIRNKGSVLHNFSVTGFPGIDLDVAPGERNNTENPALKPGSYHFFCKYHKGRGMTGELRVTSE